jgi:hypothetical protein
MERLGYQFEMEPAMTRARFQEVLEKGPLAVVIVFVSF